MKEVYHKVFDYLCSVLIQCCPKRFIGTMNMRLL